jgi:hypothetical protein
VLKRRAMSALASALAAGGALALLAGGALALLAGPAAALTITEIGAPGAPGEDGGSVVAGGSESAAGPVSVAVTARGGAGGQAPAPGAAPGDGGGADLAPVFGSSSDGGDVEVTGTAVGGAGGDADLSDPFAPAGDGASVRLVDAVDGETTGSLRLGQHAAGGMAGSFGLEPAHAGDSTSVLRRSKSAESLAMQVSARAGNSDFPRFLRQGGQGGDARAVGRAANDAGSVELDVLATGGSSGAMVDAEPEGGRADARAYAKTFGDGHAIHVGEALDLGPYVPAQNQLPALLPGPTSGAFGGRGGRRVSDDGGLIAVRGGDARSVSHARAHGDSAVEVHDVAYGGDAGGPGPLPEGQEQAGGDASSEAIGRNAGSSAVLVTSQAIGGNGGIQSAPGSGGGRGGHAWAGAKAAGLGFALAEADARAGSGSAPPRLRLGDTLPGGDADAWAYAEGATGEARVRASTNGAKDGLVLSAAATLAEDAGVEAHARAAGPLAQGSDHDHPAVYLRAAVDPLAAEVAAALQGSSAVADAMAEAEVFGLGDLELSWRQSGSEGMVTLGAEIDFARILQQFVSLPLPNTLVGFLNPRLLGDGFETLRFVLSADSVVVVDELFGDPDAAFAFFDDFLVDAGMLRHLSLDFELTAAARLDGFAVDFVAARAPLLIPEPATAGMLAAGLAGLAAVRRRSSRG